MRVFLYTFHCSLENFFHALSEQRIVPYWATLEAKPAAAIATALTWAISKEIQRDIWTLQCWKAHEMAVTDSHHSRKKMVWVSLETTLIHESRRLVEPQSTEWQNNSGTGSPCWRYVHVNSLFTHPAVAATFEPQVHGKCVIPVKYSCGAWCWSLWWCFLAGWLKKIQPKKTPNHPHTSELMEVPCKASPASTGMLRSNPSPRERQHKMTPMLSQDTSWNVQHKSTQFLAAFNSRDKLGWFL